MDIYPPGQPQPRPEAATTAPRPANLLEQLQPGQTLIARVERLLSNNEVELRIGNQVLRANSPIRLAAGQPLPLLVESSPQGPILKIAEQASQVETLARAWRTVLPRQLPVAEVVARLVNLSHNASNGNTTRQADSLRQAVRELVQHLPTRETISRADGLREAIRNSGVNLEAQLYRAVTTGKPPALEHNFKANLLRVAQTALQLQAQAQPRQAATSQSSLSPATGPGAAAPGNRPVDIYNALLNAGARQPTAGDNTPPDNRPLLPALLPLATPATPAPAGSGKLASIIPQLLQRLLPTALFGQAQRPAEQQATPQASAPAPLPASMVIELLNQLESGLARVQQHQLASQPGDEAIRHFLNLELPVFNGKEFDNVGIQVEWAEASEDNTLSKHQWRVVLNFDFEKIGKTQVVVLARQDEIHTEFRSENPLGRDIFESHRALLKEAFQRQGLVAGKFSFSSGEIEPEAANQHNDQLVKTEA